MPRRKTKVIPPTTVKDVVVRWAERTADIENLDHLAEWLKDSIYQAMVGERDAIRDQDYGRANGWQARRQTLEEVQILVRKIMGPRVVQITWDDA